MKHLLLGNHKVLEISAAQPTNFLMYLVLKVLDHGQLTFHLSLDISR